MTTTVPAKILLWRAALSLDAAEIEKLLAEHPDVDTSYSNWDDENNDMSNESLSALHIVCTSKKAESVECLRLLTSHPGIDINQKTRGGWTPLNLAVARGRTNLVKYLLETFPDISYDTTDPETTQWSPYWNAAKTDNVGILLLLMKYSKGKSEKTLDADAQGRVWDMAHWRPLIGIAGKRTTHWILKHRQNTIKDGDIDRRLRAHKILPRVRRLASQTPIITNKKRKNHLSG